MFKIDIHTHILPGNLPNFKEKYGYEGFITVEHDKPHHARMVIDGRTFRDIQDNTWDPEIRLQECNRHGVAVQVLSPIPVMFTYWAKPEATLRMAQLLNDHIADTVAHYPKRFIGLGTVPLQAPDLAVRELERCMEELHLAGVEIGSHVNGWNLDEETLFPFFQAAQDLNAALFVHPWDTRRIANMPNYWLPWLVGMPAEVSLAICSMIFGGVFERLPHLRVAFAHGGGSFPGTIGRIEHGFHVRPDLCATNNPVNPRHYLGKFYVDSLVHDQNFLSYLIRLVGPDKVALGSDYPFPLGEAKPGSLIESLPGLSASIQEQLMSGSALEWLGLNKERFLA